MWRPLQDIVMNDSYVQTCRVTRDLWNNQRYIFWCLRSKISYKDVSFNSSHLLYFGPICQILSEKLVRFHCSIVGEVQLIYRDHGSVTAQLVTLMLTQISLRKLKHFKQSSNISRFQTAEVMLKQQIDCNVDATAAFSIIYWFSQENYILRIRKRT